MKDIWDFVISQCPLSSNFKLHGINHWKSVEKFGLKLADNTGANKKIISLFALFHDCKRRSEFIDCGHGMRAVRYLQTFRLDFLKVTPEEFRKLCYACAFHTDKMYSNDITIATCWDSDRLDLTRVGYEVNTDYLNTEEAKTIVLGGKINDRN